MAHPPPIVGSGAARLDARSGVLGIASLSAALWMGWVGIAGLGAMIGRAWTLAPTVTVSTWDAGFFFGMPVFGALAVMLLYHGGTAPVRDRRNARLFTLVLANTLLMLAAPGLYGFAASVTLTDRGYEACPNPYIGLRSTSTNWHRVGTATSQSIACRQADE